MHLPKSIKDNLFFLLAETNAQIANLQVLMETASSSVAQRILDRHGYTYNLKMRIHDSCTEILRNGKKRHTDIFSLRAAETIASDLERLTNICHDSVRLLQTLAGRGAIKRQRIIELLDDVVEGMSLIERAIVEDDSQLALKVGEVERKLDREYHKLFEKQTRNIKKQKHPENTITALFVAQRIEEMGDVLLDIVESIMSARLGQPMHLDRFRSLKTALADLGLIDADVEPIAETRSGSGISRISSGDSSDDGYVAIFKDGTKDKLKEERESVESWHEIFPGLAPQIIAYNKKGKNASLLIEHLPGLTFEQILLHEPDECLDKTLKHLSKTIKAVWLETRRKKAFSAHHIQQLRKRLSTVLEVHPGFEHEAMKICGHKISSLNSLIDKAEKLENRLSPPFSVYIHGDFNIDNIIFDMDSEKIRFIDLHRSCYLDYVQDVAVFMVSNYRLQVLDKLTRARITKVAQAMYKFASGFAQKQNDKSFEVRLALGLARSFITSTRFILDKSLAKKMYFRGIYLLERLVELDEAGIKDYRLPIRELFA